MVLLSNWFEAQAMPRRPALLLCDAYGYVKKCILNRRQCTPAVVAGATAEFIGGKW